MQFTKPASNALFTVSSAAAWPSVVFQTDGSGRHTWQWRFSWDIFSAAGTAATDASTWDAAATVLNRGGTLTVTATSAQGSTTIAVRINATNPTHVEVLQYLSSKSDADGFDRIIRHETNFQHVSALGEPKKSFDGGYGLCQLTNPAPTFEQAWNWQLNIDGGLALFAQKRAVARAYLGQSGRSFTDSQLRFETVCRWNGGSYHRWDATAGRWTRAPNVLCDSRTGNIGWDMTDPANAGRSEAQLHARDSASYSSPPAPGAHWRFFGVCYADRVLG